jgi:hypothetical protein
MPTGKCWRDESTMPGLWKVQFPDRIDGFKTKKQAMAWVDQLIKDGLATPDKADFFKNVRKRS